MEVDFCLSYNNGEEMLAFPIIPNGGIQLSRDQDNQAFDGINHELQALGNMKLATFSITSFFPLRVYPYARPYSLVDGWHYVQVIEAVRKRKIPFRALYLVDGREVFNLPVTVENFEYYLDQAGDIAYSLDFKEYRFANGSAASLGTPTSASGEKTKTPDPVQSASQAAASTGSSSGGAYTKRYTKSDATIIAKIMYGEARGIKSKTEIACIAWCILNRVDAGMGKSIQAVALAANQFYYKAGAPTVSDYGYDLVALATDVLDRWSREKAGQTDVGRVLPKNYMWYAGSGGHNWFYPSYPMMRAQRWVFKNANSPYPN